MNAYEVNALKRRGIVVSALGCVMLDVKGPHISRLIPEQWTYTSTNPDRRWISGAQDEGHITLLYGLLDNANEIREDVDEVWATDCRFWQPLAALTSQEGQVSHYLYRVATPFNVLLYKTCPAAPDRFDAIALLIQPVEEDVSIAYPLMVVIDPDNADADIVMFQQRIFMQDRLILENQRPSRLPLAAGAEIPTRGDLSSVVYRRWLRQKGLKYGVHEHASA